MEQYPLGPYPVRPQVRGTARRVGWSGAATRSGATKW